MFASVHKSNCRGALNHDLHAIDATGLESLVYLRTGLLVELCRGQSLSRTRLCPEGRSPMS